MPDHIGRRRRPSRVPIARLAVLSVALAAVVRLLTLPAPTAGSVPAPAGSPLTPVPAWTGPEPVDLPARLPDGTSYQPRIYLSVSTSVGVAATPDGRYLRVLLREAGPAQAGTAQAGAAQAGGRVAELRRTSVVDNPELDGFVADGDTLVWAFYSARMLVGFWVGVTTWPRPWRARKATRRPSSRPRT